MLAAIVLLLLLFPLLNLALLAPWPRQKLAHTVGTHLGAPLSIERATVWPGAGIRLRGVRFGGGGTTGDGAYLRCESMHVSLSWPSLFTRTWRIHRIRMDQFEFAGHHLFNAATLMPGAVETVQPAPLAPSEFDPTPDESEPRAFDVSRQADVADRETPGATPDAPSREAAPAAPPQQASSGSSRPQLEVGEVLLSEGSLRVMVPGDREVRLIGVHDVKVVLDFDGANDGLGRLTIGRVDWPAGWSTSRLEAAVTMRPGPIVTLEGGRPGVDGLAWRLECGVTRPGVPFVLQLLAEDVLLTEMFDALPPWIGSRPVWINARADGLGLATNPSSVQAAINLRLENLDLRMDDRLRKHLGGNEGGRLDGVDLQSAGIDLVLRDGAMVVQDLFIKTPDGVGRSRLAVLPDGQLAGAMRLYATEELRSMISAVLPEAPWAAFEPTLWQVTQVEVGGPWQAPVMRFAGSNGNAWWPALEKLRSLMNRDHPQQEPLKPDLRPVPVP